MDKTTLFDFNFTATHSVNDVVDNIFNNTIYEAKSGFQTLITPNAYTIVQYNEVKNKYLKDFYKNSAYILPDGMPVVWLSKLLLKNSLEKRIPGSDLFPVTWERIKKENIPITLVLPNETIAARFKKDYLLSNSLVPDFFDPADDNYINNFTSSVVDQIIQSGSRFVFLGLTFPKQEILGIRIVQMLKERKYPNSLLVLLLGASFEFYFGIKKRAPAVIQKTGFEWLYRFAKEPRRLWKRYTIDNIKFLALTMKEIKKHLKH